MLVMRRQLLDGVEVWLVGKELDRCLILVYLSCLHAKVESLVMRPTPGTGRKS